MDDYLDYSGRADRISGGVQMIPVDTPKGRFRVWTKRVGNNPRIKLLLLHGGPGITHEYLEPCDSWLPAAGVEYYYYDQLGSHYSDQPDEPELWEIDRFVDEVEQVRTALGLNRDNFFLYGQSWGGLLAVEYALAHQKNLKGLIMSNMMASVPTYNRYATDVLMPQMDQDALTEIKQLEATGDTENPRYEELLIKHYYVHHILRMPPDEWPEPLMRCVSHINRSIYAPMQGPSELGASGKIEHWDRSADLSQINVPTLVIGAEHDTMDPAYLKAMASQLPDGRYHHCPNGSHMAHVDDQQTYFEGLVRFLHQVDSRAGGPIAHPA